MPPSIALLTLFFHSLHFLNFISFSNPLYIFLTSLHKFMKTQRHYNTLTSPVLATLPSCPPCSSIFSFHLLCYSFILLLFIFIPLSFPPFLPSLIHILGISTHSSSNLLLACVCCYWVPRSPRRTPASAQERTVVDYTSHVIIFVQESLVWRSSDSCGSHSDDRYGMLHPLSYSDHLSPSFLPSLLLCSFNATYVSLSVLLFLFIPFISCFCLYSFPFPGVSFSFLIRITDTRTQNSNWYRGCLSIVLYVPLSSFFIFLYIILCFVLFCFVLFCFVLFCFVLFRFVLFCFVSFRFVSFHLISFHFISFHFISFHFISFHFISFHFISFHFISFHFISFHFISFHFSYRFFLFFNYYCFCNRKTKLSCHIWTV